MKRIFLILVLIPSLAFCALAEQSRPDSLKQIWENNQQDDSVRLQALFKIVSDVHQYTQPESASYYSGLAYNFAKERGTEKEQALALNMWGVALLSLGNYEEAIDVLNKSLEISEGIDDKKNVAAPLINLGVIYKSKGDYIKAIDYYSRGLNICEALNDKQCTAASLNNIGVVYRANEDYQKATAYYKRSLAIKKEIGDKKGVATTLNNIGLNYYDHNEPEQAIVYYDSSLKMYEEIDHKMGIARQLNNIALALGSQKKYDKALAKHQSSLKIGEEIGSKPQIVSASLGISNIYTMKGRYNEAIAYGKRALVLAKEVEEIPAMRDAAEGLYKLYKLKGETPLSLEMHELYINLKDSLHSVEMQKKLIRQDFEYEYEKQALADSLEFVRQRQVDAITHQTERLMLIGGFSFIILSLAVFLRIRFIKRKAERQALLQEIKILKAEMGVSSSTGTELSRERIQATIKTKLNDSDWSILNTLYNNPEINNSEIAEQVFLSVEGVRSSLKKMYKLFGTNKNARDQRIDLIIKATKISGGTYHLN